MQIEIPPWLIDLVLWFAGLFTTQEWRALILLVASTIAATHTVKLAWRFSRIEGGDNTVIICLMSSVLALLLAPWIWPTQSVHWFIAGNVAGPLSNIVFALGFWLLKKFAPGAARTINMDRRRGRTPTSAFVPKRKADAETFR